MRVRHTTEGLIERIREQRATLGRTPSSNEFSRATGVSSGTIVRHGGWAKLVESAVGADAERDRASVVEHELRRRAREKRGEMRAVIRDLERQVSELTEINSHLLSVDELKGAFTPKALKATTQKRGRLPQAAYVMLASDWHVGERVRPDQVGGRNEYNPEIAQERGEQFWRSNLTMLNAARAAWDARDVVVWLGGDLITGYIHEEYEAENFLSPIEETMLAFRMLVEGFDFMLREYDAERIVVATSNGNHGRTEKKKRVTGDFRNSYEFMLYQLLALHYKDEPRITWQIGTGYYNVLDVFGFPVRFSHGDGVRSGGGVGGLAPPLYRRLGRLSPAGIDCMGHFHQVDFLRRFARNGSLIGWNHFAEFMGCEFEPPMQASFIVDAKHQVACNFNPIFVAKKR